MALPTRPVYITYLKSDGTPNKGYVEFTMTSDLVVSNVGIIQVHTIRQDLDINGRVDTNLLVTDNSAIQPSGWVWSVEEKIENGNLWYFDVPTADGSPLNLADRFAPTPPPIVPITDHGQLMGLGDDDHPQYLTKLEADTIYAPIGSGAGGIARVITYTSASITAGALPNTDYIYRCNGTIKITMPTALANKNMYIIKNIGNGVITIGRTDPETIDDDATDFVINVRYMSITLVSNGSIAAPGWLVI